jgi:hypothetical protein
VFAPPECEFTGNGRFDDPDKRVGDPSEGKLRVIYCASGREGAFGETIARYRKSIGLLAALAGIEDNEPLDTELEGGVLPDEWRLSRRVGASDLETSLRFVDFESVETLKALRNGLASVLAELGVEELDFSDLIGRDRRLTQQASRYVYEATDETGEPLFSGVIRNPVDYFAAFVVRESGGRESYLSFPTPDSRSERSDAPPDSRAHQRWHHLPGFRIRHTSRLNRDWELWAIFIDRMIHEPEDLYQTIARDDPDLLRAAELLDIEVE